MEFWTIFFDRLNKAFHLEQYFLADWIYIGMLMTAVLCLWRGQRAGRVDLWDTVRATKHGKIYTDARKLFEVGAFVAMTCGFSYLVIQGKLTEWYAGIYVSAFVISRALRDREQRLNRALELEKGSPADPPPAGGTLPKQAGFGTPEILIAIAIAAVFSAYTAWIYHEGGAAPRAQLEQFKAGVVAARELHAAEDARKTAQTNTIIKEKDHEREKVLADSRASWGAELTRVRAERDRISGQGSKPTPIAASVCDGTDGNQRLSDAMAKSERDTRAAIADYQAGTGELLVIAERQTTNWDNLKSYITGIRTLNTESQ